ncbi:ficolin-1-like isoform X2 [Homarus americanus]|uniref:ficolin-1-like isoform X2 n=1 Tax=Homarus americanus TaxID=6706 RepID=UPI001C478DCA|nr:ficolin-1-like isoform X2 [Homarus americanus]
MMVNQTRLIENLVDASADRDSRDKQTIGQCLGDVKTLYTQLQEGETLLRVLQEEYNTTSEERERLAEHNSRLKEKNRQIEAALNDTIKRTRTSGAADCQDVLTMGFTKSDVYTIYPRPPGTNVTVYCDQETDRGGWTVFLTRDSSLTPHLAFNRSWQEYAQGFGDLTGDHWLGNKALHFITGGSDYIMRIDVKNTDGEEAFAEWGSFSVSSEEEKYRLNVRMYNPNSTLDDVFAYSNFMFFSTHDQDNDPKPQDHICGLHNV